MSAVDKKVSCDETLSELEMISQIYPETLAPVREYIKDLESGGGSGETRSASDLNKLKKSELIELILS